MVPFPGPTGANVIAPSASDQQIFGAAAGNAPANATLPTLATITGILTNPNFRVVLHALQQRSGFEELAEPEVTTTSGRQTEMRATEIITVITGFSFQQGTAATTTTGSTP